ncbi:hypothetical protein DXG01_006219 [Tephrocybe rancida]|nr:hypothetical protein DXG01_006219 [Tephrocybe rancida]
MFSSLLLLVSTSVLLASAQGFHAIHPNGDTTKCLDVRGGLFENGTAVQIFDCNGSAAQQWNISRANTTVQIQSAQFCLDAGSTPANGVGMKIWKCFAGLPAQTWFYTDDNRIALLGKGLCLDLPNGVHANSNQLQTWACTDNNTNQVWTLD